MPVLPSTKPLYYASVQTMPSSATTTSSDTKARYASTLNANFFVNATSMAPLISSLAMSSSSSKTAACMLDNHCPNRKSPSLPKTEKTRIKSRGFQYMLVVSWLSQISKHQRGVFPHILAGHGSSIHGLYML